ncbi:argininosuccinate lyase [Ileibacterium valens]|uniref:Argininosuccinate lyase n=1 Tax=Ileibacterium valens TaxID=1862668 RepID=A0A1U7NHP1_9FIRM|nr:argininosuccinate lyase [Ileibacterium valens]OLU38303.1 argininosuccinate lyase [Erysipelotrichaceae bacterium NYU-BL-E8]OLU40628.1 argininosuccinate lyase [Erysipelotrichaceae bacterium NYU-BL-F16]OLU41400.1 argininosuccinate lyase [Ileibacterium valens]
MAKLWAGRFSKNTDETVNAFNASILFDQRLYPQDIEGSLAHSEMLARQGIISLEDKEAIHQGLKEIKEALDQKQIVLDQRYEDIHMAIEQILTEKIGDAGKRLHTGRSRNDQVALDVRLYVRKELLEVSELLKELLRTLVQIAKENTHTILPGYTHLQRAQPISFGHEMMAYANMIRRDVKRIHNTLEVMDECPLGSGALAGTTYPLDRELSASLLGFSKACDNSLDGVSDRDYCLEAMSDLSILMMHLSRLSEEVIAWCSWEFKFIELDDAFATGSSIMPQKKNPDICELIRGKTGRVYGDLMQLLTTMKGIPLAYNKDMQEDKESVFDAFDTVKICLQVLIPMLETMQVLDENMKNAAMKGFINATDMADYLTRKGMPFRDAYKITGQLVAKALEKKQGLNELSLDELKEYSDLFEDDVYDAIDLLTCLNARLTKGGPSPAEVSRQIKVMEEFIDSL